MKVSSDVLLQHVLDDISTFLVDSPERSWRHEAALSLRSSLLKKYLESGLPSDDANTSALNLFLSVNSSLKDSVMKAETLKDQYLIGELKASLNRFWFCEGDRPLVTGLHDLFLAGRVGPGSSLGAKHGDFYTKLFASRLTTTSRLLYQSYRQSLQHLPVWDTAENYRVAQLGDIEIVEHSNLLFVPKRNDISRTICVEPSLNMFYQLGLAKILEQRLRMVYNINLSKQPDFNRDLARLGSVDGSFSTIDLSSASDSLSVGVLRQILPGGFFAWLNCLRTPSTKLPDGRVVPLRMISTMGNGFTFPVETIIFTAVVEAAYRISDVPLIRNSGDTPGNFAVFGDDLIVDKRVTSSLLRLLSLLGFTVNPLKTFVEGPFRESCGCDWFSGHNVRGVYIKTLRTPQDRYVAINSLNDWSAQTGILLPRAIQYLLSTVRRVEVSPIYGLEAGIHIPFSMVNKPSYNRNGSFRTKRWVARTVSVEVADGFFSHRWSRQLFNPSGLSVAFLAGYIRSSRIPLRQREVFYTMKHSVLPFWDRIEVARSYRRFSFAQWATAVRGNVW